MEEPLENPFPYSRPVSGTGFCGRAPEIARLTGALDAGARWWVGPAGWGVSSLLDAVGARLPPGRTVRRVDLWPALSRDGVLRALGPGAVGADPAPGPGSGRHREPADAHRGDPPVLLVEGAAAAAGEWAEIVGEAREDRWDGAAVVWGSSRPGEDPGGADDAAPGPFRDAGAVRRLRLGPIPLEAWLPFVLEKFLETRRWIANEHVEAAVRRTGGHPRHTQHLFHLLWAGCEPDAGVEEGRLEGAHRTLLRREGRRFSEMWAAMTLNQRRVLRGLALEGPDASPFAASFVRAHHLTSPSSAQRALQALEARGVIRRSGGIRPVRDPLLPDWIRMREGEPGHPVAGS